MKCQLNINKLNDISYSIDNSSQLLSVLLFFKKDFGEISKYYSSVIPLLIFWHFVWLGYFSDGWLFKV